MILTYYFDNIHIRKFFNLINAFTEKKQFNDDNIKQNSTDYNNIILINRILFCSLFSFIDGYLINLRWMDLICLVIIDFGQI
ncbi:hypothetical protein DERF_001641 [Dermatophagoides farinae]|uniref:Uncharacterized protein n=1 Tax=Dermatophagoides farinae TaxID=6954 RepID=A0A922L9U7_DERFA|nr:hypothetical protein DERF_001641 [Dermatophagoides farinae]